MARAKKNRPRMAKEARKNRKLWADGCRAELLEPYVAGYTDALERGWAHERDYCAKVFNHYHAVIDWRLEDHEEPSLPLPDYNPSHPPIVDVESLPEAEQKLCAETIHSRNLVSPATRDYYYY